jgi:uncharacterized protein YukE
MRKKGSFMMSYVIWILVIAVSLVVGAIVGYFVLGVPRINELTSENLDLQEQITTLDEELQTSQTSLVQAQAEIDDLNLELDDAQDEISSLQSSVNEYQNELEDLNSLYDELQDEYDDLQVSYDNVTETLNEKVQELEDITDNYSIVLNQLDYLEDLLYDNDATYSEGIIGRLSYVLECPYLVEEDEEFDVSLDFEALDDINWVYDTGGKLEVEFLLDEDVEETDTLSTGNTWNDGDIEDYTVSFTPDKEGAIHLRITMIYWVYDTSTSSWRSYADRIMIPIAQSVEY